MKTVRKLNFGDTFRIARIINAAGITMKEISEILSIRTKADKETVQEELGMAMIGYIVDKAPKAEKQLYEFLSAISGKKTDEIANAEFTEIAELIADIFTANEDIKDFFTRAFKSATARPSTRS